MLRGIRSLSALGCVLGTMLLCACNSGSGTSCNGCTATSTILYSAAPGQIAGYPVQVNGTLGAPTYFLNAPSTSYAFTATPKSHFLYQTKYSTSLLWGYAINGSLPGGPLTAVPNAPFNLGNGSTSAVGIAITPSGSTLYASDRSGFIAGYNIHTGSGSLTVLPNSPFAIGDQPYYLAIDPAGKFLYANDPSGNVLAYAIDAADGSLAAVAGSPFALASNSSPQNLTVDASGKYLYVALANAAAIAGFSLDSTTGAVTPVKGSPFQAGSHPRALTATAGGFLYVVNSKDNTIGTYKINDGGSLTAASGSPFSIPAPTSPAGLSYPGSIVVDITGKFLWLGAPQAADLVSYSIDPGSGTLTFQGLTPLTANPGPINLAIYAP
jgi:6-phosphogluconolactonase